MIRSKSHSATCLTTTDSIHRARVNAPKQNQRIQTHLGFKFGIWGLEYGIGVCGNDSLEIPLGNLPHQNRFNSPNERQFTERDSIHRKSVNSTKITAPVWDLGGRFGSSDVRVCGDDSLKVPPGNLPHRERVNSTNINGPRSWNLGCKVWTSGVRVCGKDSLGNPTRQPASPKQSQFTENNRTWVSGFEV